MSNSAVKFQIGKSGITPGIINSLKLAFKNHKFVRVSTLKSSGRDKNSIIQMAEQIRALLDFHTEYRIIGFTIVLRRTAQKA